ncbi:histidine N-acetyltransferase-like [Branchiostoma floridae x Branchiostoma japonicum]
MNVRDVSHDDYEVVMNMASPDTFRDGFDYLPAKFHNYVDDPDTMFLLWEVDGEVVFLHVLFLQDGGQVICLKTMRAAKKCK